MHKLVAALAIILATAAPAAMQTEGTLLSITGSGITANGSLTPNVPAGYAIDQVYIQETAGNAVTGGINIGTSAAGAQVVSALTVGASAFVAVAPASILVTTFANATTLYISAAVAWNSANVNVVVKLRRAIP